jgi:hypothetical protein
MIRQFRLIWIFYKSIAPFTLTCSLLAWIIAIPGSSGLAYEYLRWVPILVLFMGILYALVTFYMIKFYPEQTVFYNNLGISRRRLFGFSFMIDILVVSGLTYLWETNFR